MKIILAVFLLGGLAFGQGARFDNFAWSTQSVSFGVALVASPGATVQVCSVPANAVPCSNLANTYSDATLTSTCPSNAQLTTPGSSSCQGAADSQGNFGFWVAPGSYQYTICGASGCSGPYYAFEPIGSSGSGATVQTLNGIIFADQYADLPTAVLACGGVNCTIVLAKQIAVAASYAVPSYVTLQFFPGGSLNVASSQILTINGPILAPSGVQLFYGTGTVTGLQLDRPEWFGPSTTIYTAVQGLATTGGTVQLGIGAYRSGYENSHGAAHVAVLTSPNITIQGTLEPQYSSDFSHMINGSIIQGSFNVSTGANGLALKNVGFDVGSTFVNANYSGSADNALSIANVGQTIGATPVSALVIENVNCLGFSASAAFHCMLIENVEGAFIHNTQSVFDSIGGVLKGSHSSWIGHYSRGHSVLAFTVKADNYAPTADDTISDIRVQSVNSGDTANLTIDAGSASIANIALANVTWNTNGNGGGIGLTSDSTFNLSNITISNTAMNSDGGGYYCLYNSGSGIATGVAINNVSCVGWVQPFAFSGAALQKSTLSNFTGFNFTSAATACGAELKLVNLAIYNVASGTAVTCATNGSLTYIAGLRTNAATPYSNTGGAAIFRSPEPEFFYIDTNGTNQLISPLAIVAGLKQSTGVQYLHTGLTTATAASIGAVATTTFSWANTWADTNYDVVCIADNSDSTGSGVIGLSGLTAKTTTQFTVSTFAVTAAAASSKFGCLGYHKN